MKYFLELIVFACGCVSGMMGDNAGNLPANMNFAQEIDRPFGGDTDWNTIGEEGRQMVDAINNWDSYEVGRLLNSVNLGVTDPKGNTFLHLAVWGVGTTDSIIALFLNQDLLRTGRVNVNAENNNHQTPLFVACQRKNLMGACLLLSSGAIVTDEIYNYINLHWRNEGLALLCALGKLPSLIVGNAPRNREGGFFCAIKRMFGY